jgi:hypothetical protein
MPRRQSKKDNESLRPRQQGGLDAKALMAKLKADSRLARNTAQAEAGRWRESD